MDSFLPPIPLRDMLILANRMTTVTAAPRRNNGGRLAGRAATGGDVSSGVGVGGVVGTGVRGDVGASVGGAVGAGVGAVAPPPSWSGGAGVGVDLAVVGGGMGAGVGSGVGVAGMGVDAGVGSGVGVEIGSR